MDTSLEQLRQELKIALDNEEEAERQKAVHSTCGDNLLCYLQSKTGNIYRQAKPMPNPSPLS